MLRFVMTLSLILNTIEIELWNKVMKLQGNELQSRTQNKTLWNTSNLNEYETQKNVTFNTVSYIYIKALSVSHKLIYEMQYMNNIQMYAKKIYTEKILENTHGKRIPNITMGWAMQRQEANTS